MNRLLTPLAAGFRLGVGLRREAYRRGWFATQRLNRPVVSIGNLTVGGSGKTPLVKFVAARLLKLGWKPSILTRGYGRRSSAGLIALAPSSERNVDPREVGDEPALLAKSLPEVPIVVSRDRYRAGLLAEERFHVDVHLLDDGFQHWALARDVDIVAVDATQPLSDAELLPAGRQREPRSALARAHLVVLTRAELADPAPLEDLVRGINCRGAVFRASTRLHSLVDAMTGQVYPPEAFQEEPVSAFCGIGNPKAFFANLKQWGFRVAEQETFGDHHVYRPVELLAMLKACEKSEAKALVTTEKDAMNLPEVVKPSLPILACVTDVELSESEAFEQALLAHLKVARVGA